MTKTEVITVEPDYQIPDEAIVQLILDGDTDLFRLLYERYYRMVWRHAYRMTGGVDAEDLANEILLKVYLNLKSFRGDSSFFTWFFSIMVRHSVNFNVKHHRRKLQLPLLEVIASEDDQEAAAIKKEIQAHVNRAMLSLNPKERAMVALSVEGFSYSEIAEQMGSNAGTVGSTLNRAKRKLARKLKRLKGSKENHGTNQ